MARVSVSGATQNGEQFVIVMGGGFSRDSSAAGNRLFMLDAITGKPVRALNAPRISK